MPGRMWDLDAPAASAQRTRCDGRPPLRHRRIRTHVRETDDVGSGAVAVETPPEAGRCHVGLDASGFLDDSGFTVGSSMSAHPNLRKTKLKRMSSDDPPRPEPPAAPDDGKVIEMGGAPPPERHTIKHRFRWRLGVGIAILATGGGIGYVIGDRHSPGDAALPRVGHSETSAVGAVTSTGVTCSMQQGTALSIGVQLVNHAGHTVNLDEMIVELPPGSSFDLVAGFWGPCGTSNRSAQPAAVALEANATTWVSATVITQLPCAIPDPVVFVIDYDGGHKLRTQFNDLGDGRYTGCTSTH
jgi:hypothetical protein